MSRHETFVSISSNRVGQTNDVENERGNNNKQLGLRGKRGKRGNLRRFEVVRSPSVPKILHRRSELNCSMSVMLSRIISLSWRHFQRWSKFNWVEKMFIQYKLILYNIKYYIMCEKICETPYQGDIYIIYFAMKGTGKLGTVSCTRLLSA